MTRQYWSNHTKHEGLITTNGHIAALLINNFNQPEIPLRDYEPYRRWKEFIAKQNDKALDELRK